MIIMSQNRKKITESLELYIDCIEKRKGEFPNLDTEIEGYCIVESTRKLRLGIYKTEKRAKEVLEEIVNRKAMFDLFKTAPAGGKEQTEMLDMFEERKIILNTYEMPKE